MSETGKVKLTDGMKRTLDRLANSKDGEIVCDGLACYIDLTPVSASIVNRLLRLVALSDERDEGSRLRRYALNGVGEALRRRPELAEEVHAMLVRGVPFTIRDDRCVEMEDPAGRAILKAEETK